MKTTFCPSGKHVYSTQWIRIGQVIYGKRAWLVLWRGCMECDHVEAKAQQAMRLDEVS